MTPETMLDESPRPPRKRAHIELDSEFEHNEHHDQKARTELSMTAMTQTLAKENAGPGIRVCWRCKALKKQVCRRLIIREHSVDF